MGRIFFATCVGLLAMLSMAGFTALGQSPETTPRKSLFEDEDDAQSNRPPPRTDGMAPKPGNATPPPAPGVTDPGGKAPATVRPPAVVRPLTPINPAGVNLIPLIDLRRDVVSGKWLNKGAEIVCETGDSSRLRLPYKPPAEYDLVVEFTALGDSDFSAAAILNTNNLFSYGYFVGTAKNSVAGFGNVRGRPPADNGTGSRSPGMIAKGGRYQATLKIRIDSITGWLDGQQVAQLPVDETYISLARAWKIGCEAIGIGTNRQATFHAVKLIEYGSKGRPIARAPFGAVRPPGAFDPTKNISLTERKPIVVQTGFDQFRVNDNLDKHLILVRGKPCEKYLFTHSPASLLYEIPPGAIAFRATGVKPAGKFNQNDGQWRYFVYIDGDEAFVSQGMKESKNGITIQTPIPKGARRIELRVDSFGGNAWDHAIWADPEFLMAP